MIARIPAGEPVAAQVDLVAHVPVRAVREALPVVHDVSRLGKRQRDCA